MSWDEEFSDFYDEWSSEQTADEPFYVGLAQENSGPIVELAVGDGRVAVPVAEATGRRVVGIDSSPAMIDRARSRAAAAGVHLDLRLSEMRDLDIDEQAGLIYCPFRSLLHLPTWGDRRRLFERVAANLRPGGRFAWNAFAFDHQLAAGFEGGHFDTPVPHSVTYDVPDNRVDMKLDGAGTSSLWWASKNEWLGLLDVAGLRVEALYGDFDRTPLTAASREPRVHLRGQRSLRCGRRDLRRRDDRNTRDACGVKDWLEWHEPTRTLRARLLAGSTLSGDDSPKHLMPQRVSRANC